MSLTISIVGRPNVGKSTLFNRIVGEQRALVHNLPGVTRDRLYATATWRVEDKVIPFTVIDTGGLDPVEGESLAGYVGRQVEVAIEESDAIIAMVDGKAGLLPDDEQLIRQLRKSGKPIFLCINKVDLNIHEEYMLPFHELGFGAIFPVSASHNRGIDDLMQALLQDVPEEKAPKDEATKETTRLAIVGRPNVGKSRLLNYLCGEERSIVSPEPGTTRDPIDTHIDYQGMDYLLIDTAGIRRQAKIDETLEYLSVLRSMRAVSRSDIAILVIDANEGVTHQELRLASQILLRGCGLICFFNKCDLIDGKPPKELPHFPFVATCKGAAKLGEGMPELMRLTKRVIQSYRKRITTSKLNKVMNKIVAASAPPRPKGRELKVRYLTQVDHSPPHLQIFVNRLNRLTENYKKYLENSLYKEFNLVGVPLRLDFKE